MSQMSLLQRLGQTKEQARETALKDYSSVARNEKSRQAEEFSTHKETQYNEEEIPIFYSEPEQEKALDDSQSQAASSFAGRRSNTAQRDTIQELRIVIHQRLVDEMTPEEQQIIARGEAAREQIKNLISSYCDRELENFTQPLSRIERQQLVEVIYDELLGLGPLESLLKDEEITEIMVNGPQDIFVEKKGKILLSDIHFYNETHLMNSVFLHR